MNYSALVSAFWSFAVSPFTTGFLRPRWVRCLKHLKVFLDFCHRYTSCNFYPKHTCQSSRASRVLFPSSWRSSTAAFVLFVHMYLYKVTMLLIFIANHTLHILLIRPVFQLQSIVVYIAVPSLRSPNYFHCVNELVERLYQPMANLGCHEKRSKNTRINTNWRKELLFSSLSHMNIYIYSQPKNMIKFENNEGRQQNFKWRLSESSADPLITSRNEGRRHSIYWYPDIYHRNSWRTCIEVQLYGRQRKWREKLQMQCAEREVTKGVW